MAQEMSDNVNVFCYHSFDRYDMNINRNLQLTIVKLYFVLKEDSEQMVNKFGAGYCDSINHTN